MEKKNKLKNVGQERTMVFTAKRSCQQPILYTYWLNNQLTSKYWLTFLIRYSVKKTNEELIIIIFLSYSTTQIINVSTSYKFVNCLLKHIYHSLAINFTSQTAGLSHLAKYYIIGKDVFCQLRRLFHS